MDPATTAEARWQQELEAPTQGFFQAFASRILEPDGERDAVRETLKTLVPRIDWEAYQPHVPHGLLGLRAVLRLRPLLQPQSFKRALAIQVHMAAHEGRRAAPPATAKGSGSWRNLEDYIQGRRPALAYAEAQGFELPEASDFQRLGRLVAPDMANVGHKAVFAHQLGDLQERLEHPKATGRRMFGLAAWLAATVEDTFWYRRAGSRLGPLPFHPSIPPASPDETSLQAMVRDTCDLGLVNLLDRLSDRVKQGLSAEDLLASLVLAASEKLLDARRDLEGKTAWTFVYLATLAEGGERDPRVWAQAAALVNLFPTDEAEERVRPRRPTGPVSGPVLVEAILDAEAEAAMGLAEALCERDAPEEVLAALVEAATRNDPTFNHAHQVLAVAAAADLMPHLSSLASKTMLVALAKSLANSQGSGDLGRMADRVLTAGR